MARALRVKNPQESMLRLSEVTSRPIPPPSPCVPLSSVARSKLCSISTFTLEEICCCWVGIVSSPSVRIYVVRFGKMRSLVIGCRVVCAPHQERHGGWTEGGVCLVEPVKGNTRRICRHRIITENGSGVVSFAPSIKRDMGFGRVEACALPHQWRARLQEEMSTQNHC